MKRAKSRCQLYKQIMETKGRDDKLMYKLIAKQRGYDRQHCKGLRVDNKLVTERGAVLKAWASHFHTLGKKVDKPHFDKCHRERVSKVKDCIENVVKHTKPFTDTRPITVDEVSNAVSKLNTNKAADSKGLTAEHLKFAVPHSSKSIHHLP